MCIEHARVEERPRADGGGDRSRLRRRHRPRRPPGVRLRPAPARVWEDPARPRFRASEAVARELRGPGGAFPDREWIKAQPGFVGAQGKTVLDPDFDIDAGGLQREKPALPAK